MKWLLFLSILLSILPELALADCFHGCADTNLNIGDYIVIESIGIMSCSPSCGDQTISYTFRITTACGFSTITNPPQTFCSAENIPTGAYQVNAIGAGCTGTPQGCVRICSCSP